MIATKISRKPFRISWARIAVRVRLLALPILVTLASGAYAQNDALLERETYLVEGILACGNCHTPKNADAEPITELKFAGGFVIEEPGVAAYASNITMDEQTGIGAWTDEEIIVAIRDGLRPDGTLIGPPMPSPFYRGISDNDARAIVAYMRSLPPIRNVVPASEYTIPLPPAYGPPVGEVPDVSPDDVLAYATYVAVTLGHCTECHTPMVDGMHDFSRKNEGGRVFENLFGLGGVAVSRNITPHPLLGIGEWTDEEIKRAITQGISRDGREHVIGMGYSYYATMTDEDLDALVTYLRSVPPSPASQQLGAQSPAHGDDAPVRAYGYLEPLSRDAMLVPPCPSNANPFSCRHPSKNTYDRLVKNTLLEPR